MASVKTETTHSCLPSNSVAPAAKSDFEQFFGTHVPSTCRKLHGKGRNPIKINSGEVWQSATQDDRLLTVLHKLNHFHERPTSASANLRRTSSDDADVGMATRSLSLRSSQKHNDVSSTKNHHHAALKPKKTVSHKPRRAATVINHCERMTRSMRRKCASIDNPSSSTTSTSNESQELLKIFEQAKHAGFVVPTT